MSISVLQGAGAQEKGGSPWFVESSESMMALLRRFALILMPVTAISACAVVGTRAAALYPVGITGGAKRFGRMSVGRRCGVLLARPHSVICGARSGRRRYAALSLWFRVIC